MTAINENAVPQRVRIAMTFSLLCGFPPLLVVLRSVSGVSRAKIDEVTLNALRTRQSLVKGERLVRHEVRAVLPVRAW